MFTCPLQRLLQTLGIAAEKCHQLRVFRHLPRVEPDCTLLGGGHGVKNQEQDGQFIPVGDDRQKLLKERFGNRNLMESIAPKTLKVCTFNHQYDQLSDWKAGSMNIASSGLKTTPKPG